MSIQMKIINMCMKYTIKPVLTYMPVSNALLSPTKLAVDIVTHIALRPKAKYKTQKLKRNLYGEWVLYDADLSILDNKDKKVILYLHGGGYVFGSPSTHRTITSALSKHTNCIVFALDYRKAPEHNYPTALDDAFFSYKWLISKGFQAKNIGISGDSAGGNLTLALTRKILDSNFPAPAAICPISPWCALYDRKEYYTDNKLDPMLPGSRVREVGEMYAGKHDVKSGKLSPVHMNFSNFPPTFMVYGEAEMLKQSMIETFHYLNRDSGGEHNRIVEYKDCPHVFQIFYGIVPESRQSIIEISKFFNDIWSKL